VSSPEISVVISTRDRPERLSRLLGALRAQTLAVDRFEVVVVQDGGGLASAQLLETEVASGVLALRLAHHPRSRGAAAGRNTGGRLARAELVAFTDDDCAPEPRWLSAALAAASMHPGAIIQGPTLPDPREADQIGLLARTVQVERLGPQYETCNMIYPRRLLERLGGFDEGFGVRAGGEDTDLAWRALDDGVPAVFAADALVFHAVERLGPQGLLRDAKRWDVAGRLFAKHPGRRSLLLYRGLFWNVWHYLLWRSLLAFAGPRWLRRLVIARHLAALRRRATDERAGASAVPLLLVLDAVECWAVARGAIRARTFVL
jgi:GT2 family glycosyltransferase